jgi:hypothetical protein
VLWTHLGRSTATRLVAESQPRDRGCHSGSPAQMQLGTTCEAPRAPDRYHPSDHVWRPPAGPPPSAGLARALYGPLSRPRVTAIRDVGSFDGSSLRVREAVCSGAFAGPCVFAWGPLMASGRHSVTEASFMTPEGRPVVSELHGLHQGVPESLAGAAEEPYLPVIGHLPASAPWDERRI